jgi:hypothetical protein
MSRARVLLPTSLVLAATLLSGGGCGNNTSPRLLQSISITPASADAQSFPNGQVQFTVMGSYNQPPSPSPMTASQWLLSEPNIATISQGGVAQCTPGASGVVTVKAVVPAPCSGTGCSAVALSGNAKLSCP